MCDQSFFTVFGEVLDYISHECTDFLWQYSCYCHKLFRQGFCTATYAHAFLPYQVMSYTSLPSVGFVLCHWALSWVSWHLIAFCSDCMSDYMIGLSGLIDRSCSPAYDSELGNGVVETSVSAVSLFWIFTIGWGTASSYILMVGHIPWTSFWNKT